MRRHNSSFRNFITFVCFLGLISVVLTSHQNVSADTASVGVNPSVISEGDDFATRVLGLPWDMNSTPYPDYQAVFSGIDRNSFVSANGEWSFKTSNNDPNIMPLSFGIPGTQKVLKMGDGYPIDASKYKLLSYWLCSDQSDWDMIFWFLKQSWTDQVYTTQGNSQIQTISGCKLYVINLSKDSNWKGSPDGLRIDPVMKPGVNLRLGWIRLTTANFSNVVTVSWSGGIPNSKTYVYVGKTCSLTDATPVGIVNTSAGKFDWGASLIPIGGGDSTLYPLPESFEPGSYKVFALENNTGNPSCSDVTIQKAPILEFQSPGYLSGPDYATTVVGNSWGMSGPEDISDTYDLHNQNFDNGIFTAVTGSTGDPRINLNVTQPIDTAKYKYATFRMYLEGTRDVGSGWIQRFLWWSGSPDLSNFGTTSDMIVYEGWHTYTINLSQAPLASGIPWTGTKNALRLDPDEVPGPVTVHLDYVTLTGDQVVNRGSIFPVIYQVTGSANSRITFYTDNDKNPGNGRTPATGTFSTDQTAQVQTNGGLKLFIPFINNHFPDELSNLLTGSTWNWNTAQTPAGTYYLSADVTDGVVTTTWYSDLPVTVR